MKNEITLAPTFWASVSGGKDSLYMLKLILEHLDEYPLNGVVHFELEIDFPFIKNVIDYMETECKKHNIPFLRIKPRVSWFDMYEKYGFPTRIARWCNSKYKLDAQRQLEQFMKERGTYVVSYIGFCADEINRFRYDLNNRSENVRQIYPLAEKGIEEKTILEWAKNIPIFNDFYKFNERCGCMYCPLSSMRGMSYLLKYYPNEYDKFITMAKETEEKRAKELNKTVFSVFSSDFPRYQQDVA